MVGKRRSPRATLNNAGAGGSEGPSAKRVTVGHATALTGLTLKMVMQFAGKHEGIFIANVCHSWEKSYKSTFKGEICQYGDCVFAPVYSFCTHRAAAMLSLQRVHWVWTDTGFSEEHDPSRYLGKYAPRLVVKAAILDESLALSSEDLMRGVAASGRLGLMEDLWQEHILCASLPEGKGLGDLIAKLGPEAAAHGYLKIVGLVWTRIGDTDKPCCGKLCADAAVRGGHIAILEFLSLTDWWSSGSGPEFLGGIAAAYNQVKVLRWLSDHGHPWDADVALSAAARASVETISYLFENECPGFDEDFVTCCVRYQSLDALQWSYDTLRVRVPGAWTEANLQECVLLACTQENTHVAEFLLDHGALWPNIGQRFGEKVECKIYGYSFHFTTSSHDCRWSADVLEWAVAKGCTLETWTTTTCARLVKEADWRTFFDRSLLDSMTWAHAHGCPCECVRDEPDF